MLTGRVLSRVIHKKKLIEVRLTDPTANKTYLEFGHDTTIELVLTALGLAA